MPRMTLNIPKKDAGIADDNVVEMDDLDAADNDYAKFTANGLEGRSYAEVRSDLNIEDGADVTDTANVTVAGALMDSEVDTDLKTFSLPASTTISAFGKTLIDDADASTVRTTLDVDQAGTDNSTDVALAGTPDYITLTGQQITRNQIDLTADVTGELPTANVANLSGTNTGDATPSYVQCDTSSAQSIGNGSLTVIDFDRVWSGDSSMWSSGDPSKITVSRDGNYLISVLMVWSTDSNGIRQFQMTKNGSATRMWHSDNAPGAGKYRQRLMGAIELAADDYVEFKVYQNTGGNLDLDQLDVMVLWMCEQDS